MEQENHYSILASDASIKFHLGFGLFLQLKQSTLLAHIQLMVHCKPQVLFHSIAASRGTYTCAPGVGGHFN